MFAAATPPKPTPIITRGGREFRTSVSATRHTISVRHYSVLFSISFSSIWTPKFQRIVVFLRSLEAKKGASN